MLVVVNWASMLFHWFTQSHNLNHQQNTRRTVSCPDTRQLFVPKLGGNLSVVRMSSTTEYNSFPPTFAVLGPRVGDPSCLSRCSARAVWLRRAETRHSVPTPLHSWPHGSRDLERPQAATTTCRTGCPTHFECGGLRSGQHCGTQTCFRKLRQLLPRTKVAQATPLHTERWTAIQEILWR